MAEIICQECNKQVDDILKTCPNCGFPVHKKFSFCVSTVHLLGVFIMGFVAFYLYHGIEIVLAKLVIAMYNGKVYYDDPYLSYLYYDRLYFQVFWLPLIFIVIGIIFAIFSLFCQIKKKKFSEDFAILAFSLNLTLLLYSIWTFWGLVIGFVISFAITFIKFKNKEKLLAILSIVFGGIGIWGFYSLLQNLL